MLYMKTLGHLGLFYHLKSEKITRSRSPFVLWYFDMTKNVFLCLNPSVFKHHHHLFRALQYCMLTLLVTQGHCSVCTSLFLFFFPIESSQQLAAVGAHFSEEETHQGHTAGRWWNWDFNPSALVGALWEERNSNHHNSGARCLSSSTRLKYFNCFESQFSYLHRW